MATQARDVRMPAERELSPPGRLSGRMVGELAAGEQLLIWALRQRLHDAEPASPVLVHGFRLAFGLSRIEAALAAFEGLFAGLASHSLRDLGLCPLRCACLSTHEQELLTVVAVAQLGRTFRLEARVARLVAAEAEDGLCLWATCLANALMQAGLALPIPAAACEPDARWN